MSDHLFPVKLSLRIDWSELDYLKNTGFSICHQNLNEQGEVAAEARDVMVMFDFNTNTKIPFPKDLIQLIEKLEKKRF